MGLPGPRFVHPGIRQEGLPARRGRRVRETEVMSLSGTKHHQARMSLPPDVRKHVALRLPEPVDPDEALDMVSASWLSTEAAAESDALQADPARATSRLRVSGVSFDATWAARS